MSNTGVNNISTTNFAVTNNVRVGPGLSPGEAGSVLTSNGENLAVSWGTNNSVLPNALTMGDNLSLLSGNPSFNGGVADTINGSDTTYQGSTTIDIDIATSPDTINVLKTPGTLTLTGAGVGTFDGATNTTINITDTNTTYTGGDGIDISGADIISVEFDNDTIILDGTDLSVDHVPEYLTAGTNISYSSGTTYDGSTAITISSTNTDTTYTGGDGIDISGSDIISVEFDNDTIILDGTDLAVDHVPEYLTAGTNISYSSGTTFNGSTAITISSTNTDTTYTGGDGIDISGADIISVEFDNDTIILDGTDLAVDHVPEYLTAGTNISYSSGTTFNGSSAITISSTDTNTTYSAGDNINVGGPGNQISVDKTMTNQNNIQFETNGTATTIVGSDYPSAPTVCTYLDLSSTTNISPSVVSPFLATKVQQTYFVRTVGTAFIEYSSNFRTSFVAQSANVLVEFQAVIAAYSKVFYGGLYDYVAGSFWTTPQTQTRFKYDNGVDQDPTTLYWYLTGLTAGTTYYISPYFKSSSASSYIYTGNSGTANSFAPGIFRVSDGGENVSVY